jgi:predicted permease
MRDVKPLARLHDVITDVRHAGRRLCASSGVSSATILTWTVGMAAMTTILGFVNAFMFRPMPVDSPDRIVSISTGADGHVSLPHGLSFVDLQDYRKETSSVFVDLVGYQPTAMTLTVGGTAEPLATYTVTDNYFSVLGVQPAAGRLFQVPEGRARGEAPVLVLSHRFWQRRFGAAPSVVGERVRLNGRPFTIIGVASETFERAHSFIQPSAYVPVWMADDLTNTPAGASMLEGRDKHQLWVLGRLKPGVSLDQARASLEVITRRLAQAYPADERAPLVAVPETHARPTPNVGQQLRSAGAVFVALAMLLFVLAGTNVANLIVARALSRERDVAIRSALGAGRLGLVSQLLMDSVLLALLANVIAIPLSVLALKGVEQWLAGGAIGVALRPDFSLDGRLVDITFILAVLAGIGAGIAPALFVTRRGASSLLNQGRQATSGPQSSRLRKGLLIAQVALSFMLLVSGALFARSLWNAHRTDLGFEPRGVALANASPRDAAYDVNRCLDFYVRALDRVKALPGIESAGWASWVPFSTSPSILPAWPANEAPEPGRQPPRIGVAQVTPDYLTTLRVPLRDGRGFDISDSQNSKKVGLINQALARKFWPNQHPIGREIVVAGTRIEVVGVVDDGKYTFIWESPQSILFRPLTQDTPGRATLVVRVAREGGNQLLELERTLRAVDPLVGVVGVRTMSEYLDVQGSAFLAFRLGAVVATVFGIAGLLLASIGLYGLMASEVRRRKQDIGIRLALGAPVSDTLRTVLGQAARVALIGVAAGAVLAVGIGKLIEPLLLNVKAVDALTYIVVGVVLVSTCELASLLPAFRATRISPATVLRSE